MKVLVTLGIWGVIRSSDMCRLMEDYTVIEIQMWPLPGHLDETLYSTVFHYDTEALLPLPCVKKIVSVKLLS